MEKKEKIKWTGKWITFTSIYGVERTKYKRNIETHILKPSLSGMITGFSHLREGVIGGEFTPRKIIPCVIVVVGTRGTIYRIPYEELNKRHTSLLDK